MAKKPDPVPCGDCRHLRCGRVERGVSADMPGDYFCAALPATRNQTGTGDLPGKWLGFMPLHDPDECPLPKRKRRAARQGAKAQKGE